MISERGSKVDYDLNVALNDIMHYNLCRRIEYTLTLLKIDVDAKLTLVDYFKIVNNCM